MCVKSRRNYLDSLTLPLSAQQPAHSLPKHRPPPTGTQPFKQDDSDHALSLLEQYMRWVGCKGSCLSPQCVWGRARRC